MSTRRDSNIEGDQGNECSRHSWRTTNPTKDCPHCHVEDMDSLKMKSEIKMLHTKLSLANEKLKKAISALESAEILIEGKNELLISYRVGTHPKDSTWKKLDNGINIKDVLTQLQSAEATKVDNEKL